MVAAMVLKWTLQSHHLTNGGRNGFGMAISKPLLWYVNWCSGGGGYYYYAGGNNGDHFKMVI